MARRACFAIALASGVAFACNALTGVGDLEVEQTGPDAGEAGVPRVVDAQPPAVARDTGPPDTGPPDTGPAPKTCTSGRRCTPTAAPGGWDGPAIVYDGKAADVPACPSGTAPLLDAFVGPPNAPFSCAPCACGGLEQVTCAASVQMYTDATCSVFLRSDTLTTTCAEADPGTLGFKVTTSATGGFCKSSGGGINKGPVTWPSAVRVCAAAEPSPDGCLAGEVCVSDPAPDFEARLCLVHDGDLPCPQPWTSRRLVYTAANDTRACASTCGCEAPVNVTCNGVARQYASAACSGAPSTVSVPTNGCVAATPPASARLSTQTPLAIDTGSCPPKGASTPSGAAVPTGTKTVCCLP